MLNSHGENFSVHLLGEFHNAHGDLVEGFSCDGQFFITFGAGRFDCSIYEFIVWDLSNLTQIAVSRSYNLITSVCIGQLQDGSNVVAVGQRDLIELVQFRTLTRLEKLVLDKANEMIDRSATDAVEAAGKFVNTRATLLDHTSNLHFFCLWDRHLDTSINQLLMLHDRLVITTHKGTVYVTRLAQEPTEVVATHLSQANAKILRIVPIQQYLLIHLNKGKNVYLYKFDSATAQFKKVKRLRYVTNYFAANKNSVVLMSAQKLSLLEYGQVELPPGPKIMPTCQNWTVDGRRMELLMGDTFYVKLPSEQAISRIVTSGPNGVSISTVTLKTTQTQDLIFSRS